MNVILTNSLIAIFMHQAQQLLNWEKVGFKIRLIVSHYFIELNNMDIYLDYFVFRNCKNIDLLSRCLFLGGVGLFFLIFRRPAAMGEIETDFLERLLAIIVKTLVLKHTINQLSTSKHSY